MSGKCIGGALTHLQCPPAINDQPAVKVEELTAAPDADRLSLSLSLKGRPSNSHPPQANLNDDVPSQQQSLTGTSVEAGGSSTSSSRDFSGGRSSVPGEGGALPVQHGAWSAPLSTSRTGHVGVGVLAPAGSAALFLCCCMSGLPLVVILLVLGYHRSGARVSLHRSTSNRALGQRYDQAETREEL